MQENSKHLVHKYGPQVILLNDLYLLTLLEKFSTSKCVQPLMTDYLRHIYTSLLIHALNTVCPSVQLNTKTRMSTQHPNEAILNHMAFDPSTPLVTVNIARAGTVPAQICYDHLNYLFNAENIRQDHFYLNRKVNSESHVIGVDSSGSKVGGPINDSFVIIPDPMGATGGTICHAVDLYKNEVKGTAKKFIALHLILTPEYIERVTKEHPDVLIIGARLDRGLSSPKALEHPPGTYPEEEKGLNEFQYIVPGAGGIGELMNNAVE